MIRWFTLAALLTVSILPGVAFAQADKAPSGGSAVETVELAPIGAWSLRRHQAPGGPVACEATYETGMEQGLWVGAASNLMAFGFSGLGSAAVDGPIPVTISWDGGNRGSMTVTMGLEAANGISWRAYVTPNTEPDDVFTSFMDASSVTFRYDGGMVGPQSATYSLAGSSRALRAAVDCAMPGAMPGGGQASGQSGSEAPRVAGEPYVIRGTCRLVVEGVTYIDRRGDCPIWMENDGSGGFWINTDREGTLPDYFAELSPMGDGTASGHWNGSPGATHAQGFLGEDFRMGAGGCWIGQRATICAAR